MGFKFLKENVSRKDGSSILRSTTRRLPYSSEAILIPRNHYRLSILHHHLTDSILGEDQEINVDISGYTILEVNDGLELTFDFFASRREIEMLRFLHYDFHRLSGHLFYLDVIHDGIRVFSSYDPILLSIYTVENHGLDNVRITVWSSRHLINR